MREPKTGNLLEPTRWNASVRLKASNLINSSEEINPEQQVILAALHRGDGVAADHFIDSAINGLSRNDPVFPPEKAHAVAQRMLLLQPVGDNCNLACSYCYETGRRDTLKQKKMSLNILDSILQNTLPFVSLPFSIFVHGGEPLLAGKAFFKELAKRTKSFPLGDQITLGVQTNGLLVDEEWADIFREFDFKVGLSLDGPKEVHDHLRVRLDGTGSYDNVLKAIKLLQREMICFGVISVLSVSHFNNPNIVSNVFDHFIKLGVDQFDIHPANSPIPSSKKYNLNPIQYAQLMIDLFEKWVKHGDPNVKVRSIDHFFQAMSGTSAEICYRSGKCTSIIGVQSDGRAIPCTRPFDSSYSFGNLVESSLYNLQKSVGFKNFVDDEKAGRDQTSECHWSSVCGQGGCPHERESHGVQDVKGRHIYCTCASKAEGGYPEVYRHYSKRIEEILEQKNRKVGWGL